MQPPQDRTQHLRALGSTTRGIVGGTGRLDLVLLGDLVADERNVIDGRSVDRCHAGSFRKLVVGWLLTGDDEDDRHDGPHEDQRRDQPGRRSLRRDRAAFAARARVVVRSVIRNSLS